MPWPYGIAAPRLVCQRTWPVVPRGVQHSIRRHGGRTSGAAAPLQVAPNDFAGGGPVVVGEALPRAVDAIHRYRRARKVIADQRLPCDRAAALAHRHIGRVHHAVLGTRGRSRSTPDPERPFERARRRVIGLQLCSCRLCAVDEQCAVVVGNVRDAADADRAPIRGPRGLISPGRALARVALSRGQHQGPPDVTARPSGALRPTVSAVRRVAVSRSARPSDGCVPAFASVPSAFRCKAPRVMELRRACGADR